MPGWDRVTRILNEAIRNGTHSRTTQTVCEACREWCSGIFYIGPTGTRFCAACADKFGQGPESIDKRRREGK
jgi:hypothetical protein